MGNFNHSFELKTYFNFPPSYFGLKFKANNCTIAEKYCYMKSFSVYYSLLSIQQNNKIYKAMKPYFKLLASMSTCEEFCLECTFRMGQDSDMLVLAAICCSAITRKFVWDMYMYDKKLLNKLANDKTLSLMIEYLQKDLFIAFN